MLKELKTFHGFAQKEAEQWTKIVKDINQAYEAIADVASARSAHVKAYQAAMTTLFELEMKAIAHHPSTADGKTQHEAAFAAANSKIGQPPHKADRKYHIEAFLLTIELRLMLAQIASARVSRLPLTSKEPDRHHHRKIWTTFVEFLYDSCIKDCEKATSLAHSCSALRQEVRASAVGIRCTFEKDRFGTIEDLRKINSSNKAIPEQASMRENLGALIARQATNARAALSVLRKRYFKNQPTNSRDDVDADTLWFKENCASRAEKVFVAYEDLREHVLKPEVFYESVSLREKQDIIKALGFGHAGHFYNCPNGHTFVITECGGAMEASTCPECRAPIGGGSHRLMSSNTRAVEFEELARGSGATENPWAPGGYMANTL